MKITLIITTYNWKEALELVLLSVLNQTRMPDELIIADDGSREDTRELIESMIPKFSIPVHHIWHEDEGFRRCAILNKAFQQVTSDYIIQADGDVILHPKFIADHETFSAPGHFIRGYRVRLSEAYSPEVLDKKIISFGPMLNGFTRILKTARMPILSKIFRKDICAHDGVYGCNLSYWRDDAFKVNGYNEDISGWGTEDEEFIARITFTGVKRRKIRHALKQYHLHHEEASMDRLALNQSILAQTISERVPYCTNGIVKNYTP